MKTHPDQPADQPAHDTQDEEALLVIQARSHPFRDGLAIFWGEGHGGEALKNGGQRLSGACTDGLEQVLAFGLPSQGNDKPGGP
jgi:hypothetical protein